MLANTVLALGLADLLGQQLRQVVFIVLLTAAMAGILLDIYTEWLIGGGLLLGIVLAVDRFGATLELAFLLIVVAVIIRAVRDYEEDETATGADREQLADMAAFVDGFLGDKDEIGNTPPVPDSEDDDDDGGLF